jgi:uncharacterized protein YndB with AHSA1/START domain
MKTEITTDLHKATFEAKREFNADISLVWRAWTEPELRDQWWAPAPWICETKSMDFSEGGRWHYDMEALFHYNLTTATTAIIT